MLGLYLTGTPPNKALEVASIASLVAVGVGVGVGIVLVVSRPGAPAMVKPSARAGVQSTATVGPGSIGLAGTF